MPNWRKSHKLFGFSLGQDRTRIKQTWCVCQVKERCHGWSYDPPLQLNHVFSCYRISPLSFSSTIKTNPTQFFLPNHPLKKMASGRSSILSHFLWHWAIHQTTCVSCCQAWFLLVANAFGEKHVSMHNSEVKGPFPERQDRTETVVAASGQRGDHDRAFSKSW